MTEILDELIRVGLMFGAVFQLICIAAVILVPNKEDVRDNGDSSDDEGEGSYSQHSIISHKHQHSVGQHQKRGRHEKKKRR